MEWNGVLAALAGAVVSAALAIVWSVVDRRRSATDALVAEAYAAFEALFNQVTISRKSPIPRLRGRSWLAELIDAEAARTKLAIHLGARRWRSKRLGLRETLRTEQVGLRLAATDHAERDTDQTREAFTREVNLARATLGRWIAHRRSFWHGDISEEIRCSLQSENAVLQHAPGWWLQIRPGRGRD